MTGSSSALSNSIESENTMLWQPSAKMIESALLTRFLEQVSAQTGETLKTYQQAWEWSVEHPAQFWSLLWDFCGVIGEKGARDLIDAHLMPGAQFFPDAKINWAENLLKYRSDDTAIIFRNELGGETTLSFNELAAQVAKLQAVLLEAGVVKGDRVAGWLPNLPETLVGALATASIGAIWSSASPDFGVQGVLDRFGQIEPKVLITVDGYYYNGKKLDGLDKLRAVQPQLPNLQKTLVIPFINETPDLSGLANTEDYHQALAARPETEPVFQRLPFNHPLFIMFSSGTTGIPKCILHGHGGTLLQHLKEHQLQCDIKPGDRVFYYTTCGWMMWNWQISALASGATLLLYDGSPFYPDGHVLWEYTSKHQATLFGTAAKYIDALKANDYRPGRDHDLSSIRTLTSTGSPLVHESFDYIYEHIKQDLHVASISGGTDIVSCFVLGNPISPVFRGEIQGAGLGLAVNAYDDNGNPLPAGAGSGELVCEKPFPCMPVGFWNDPESERYRAAYFERFDNIWCHGDWIERTGHGGYIIHGRSDATLNPGGVRIGTAEIYRQVEQIPEILESIAVGQDWDGDVRIVLFVRLKEGKALNDDVIARLKTQIRNGASPRHVPAKIIAVNDIPRTKSNKIVELAVREVIHGRPVKNVEALANPEALELYKDLDALKN